LQAEYAAAGKPLTISLTLPVLTSGLTSLGLGVVQSAIDNGTSLAVVNIMTMNLDGADARPMGAKIIDSMNSLRQQLAVKYPGRSDAQLWAMVGVTPMIGQNDYPAEKTFIADAVAVRDYAVSKNVGRIAMWSINRDRACPTSGPVDTNTCSSVPQTTWQFSQVFESGTVITPTAPSGPTVPPGPTTPAGPTVMPGTPTPAAVAGTPRARLPHALKASAAGGW
jgi:hypothetical protein